MSLSRRSFLAAGSLAGLAASAGTARAASVIFDLRGSEPAAGPVAPVAADDSLSVTEDTPVTSLDVLGNDTDAEGDALSVTSATAAHGVVAINSDGTLSYTPDADYNGPDVIHY
ncbi:MAG TPA: Ig-like domain-containing protein, partial [Hyphomicrobiales bacterium]|nr:Ig-like domain-containing protein [Hyphomicrobiales bacterium]